MAEKHQRLGRYLASESGAVTLNLRGEVHLPWMTWTGIGIGVLPVFLVMRFRYLFGVFDLRSRI